MIDIIDIYIEFVVKKAFNKNIKLIKRLPFIIIYFIIGLLATFISLFLGVNYILINQIYGYFLVLLGLTFFVMLLLPILYKITKKDLKW